MHRLSVADVLARVTKLAARPMAAAAAAAGPPRKGRTGGGGGGGDSPCRSRDRCLRLNIETRPERLEARGRQREWEECSNILFLFEL